MLVPKKYALKIATTVYWVLLIYIIAALIWWFISLLEQSQQMANYKLLELKADDPQYLSKVQAITEQERREAAKYVGEGSTFLMFILFGAVFIYRAVRRQFKMVKQQQNFMMAITHELKTPIAVARLNLETLQKHRLDEAKQQKLIQMTLEETNRLNALANNILISSQLEEGAYSASKEDLDISALAHTCVEQYKTRFPDRPWNVQIEDDVAIEGDTLLLQMLINNLLDNAVKYSPRNSTIHFSLFNNQQYTVDMIVSDEGPGIPDKEKGRIFERFYRIGDESTRKTKGTGLGLFICKKIADAHNANISVTNNSPTGATFTIHFRL